MNKDDHPKTDSLAKEIEAAKSSIEELNLGRRSMLKKTAGAVVGGIAGMNWGRMTR